MVRRRLHQSTRALRLFLTALLVLLLAVAVGGQPLPDPFVVIEVWTELDPLVADGTERPLPREVAMERLVEEARLSLSGMVYGYRFTYVPGDPGREVREQFDLAPVGEIRRGDSGFDVVQTWVEGTLLYARVSYALHDEQHAWFTGWRSSAHPRSAGVGTAPFIGGPSVKTQALADGVRMAVREHVRALEFNRPRRIEGAAILADPPAYGVRDGSYEAHVVAYLQVDRIQPYRVY